MSNTGNDRSESNSQTHPTKSPLNTRLGDLYAQLVAVLTEARG